MYIYNLGKETSSPKSHFLGDMLVLGMVSKLKQQRGCGHCYIEREKRLGRGGRKFKVAS